MPQLREDKRNLSFYERYPLATLPKDGKHPSLTTNMEIDQLTVTSISLTFWTNTFLHESDDLVPLDTPIIVFLDSVAVM